MTSIMPLTGGAALAETEVMRTNEDRTVLVLADAAGPGRLVELPRRPWDRLRARLRAATLDAQLAAGAVPDHDRLLAVRAGRLVEPQYRATLARQWTDLLDRARRPRGVTDPRIPLARGRVLAAEADIRELADGLRAAVPVPARGVALANLVLTDGTGPLYSRRPDQDLRAAVRDVIAHLDPAAELTTAALDG
jgi:hypothetical protein